MGASDFSPELDDAYVEFFEHNGYLAIDRITTDEELVWLTDLYDRIFTERSGESEGLFFDLGGVRGHDGEDVLPQVLVPERRFPELMRTIYQRNALRLAARLLRVDPAEATAAGHMISKPPRFGRETPWHQDEAYWDPQYEHLGLSVWMPLQDATVESGCMQFVPGTHRYEVKTHRHIDDDPNVHGLVLDGAHPTGAVACPLRAGGATFHHCRILHYAGPNSTDFTRRAYITVVNTKPRRREVPAERSWLEKKDDRAP